MIRTAYYPFLYGILEIDYEESGIVRLGRTQKEDGKHQPSALSDRVFAQIEEYLNGSRKNFDFPYLLKGTDFQKKVWQELCQIPYGETRCYKDIAAAIGNHAASRAVGMACSKNPIWIAVPCHRVIGSDGVLTGYAGGLPMKQELLSLERRFSGSILVFNHLYGKKSEASSKIRYF